MDLELTARCGFWKVSDDPKPHAVRLQRHIWAADEWASSPCLCEIKLVGNYTDWFFANPELGVPYEVKKYHRKDLLAPPELRDVHPIGHSPVVTILEPGATEPVVLAESGFIYQYMVEHYSQGKLAPKHWKDGQEGKLLGETEEWQRYQYILFYSEGSWMPFLLLQGIFSCKSGLHSHQASHFALHVHWPCLTERTDSHEGSLSPVLHPTHYWRCGQQDLGNAGHAQRAARHGHARGFPAEKQVSLWWPSDRRRYSHGLQLARDERRRQGLEHQVAERYSTGDVPKAFRIYGPLKQWARVEEDAGEDQGVWWRLLLGAQGFWKVRKWRDESSLSSVS